MVALSPRTCVEMGIELSDEDKRKPYVEVSGRKGLGVKADDLINKLIDKALEEVTSRHAEETEASRRTAATTIAVAALRYFMLKYTRSSVIAFDFGEALGLKAKPARTCNTRRCAHGGFLLKLDERGEQLPDFAAALSRDAMARQLGDEECWQLLLVVSKADAAIERAVTSGEPSHVARFAFQLAQAFSSFYQKFPCARRTRSRKRKSSCCG